MNQRNFPASFWNSEYKPPALPLSFAGVPYDVMKGITSPFHPLYGSCASTLSHRPGLSPFETFSASASLPSLPSHLSPTPEQWYAAYPSGLGTNYSTQNCYSQQAAINAAAAAAATDLYGLSSAASHPLDHRYSSLLAQQNSAAIELARMRASGTVASLAASLASPVSDIGKDAMGLWATTRFPGMLFICGGRVCLYFAIEFLVVYSIDMISMWIRFKGILKFVSKTWSGTTNNVLLKIAF